MKTAVCRVFGLLLAIGLSTAQAAPNIPPSEMPGRERQRFQETPLDRFTDPLVRPRSVEPLWRCDQRSRSRDSTARSKSNKKRQGC